MKVLLLNGSPHEKGCVCAALTEVAGAIRSSGIETEIFWIGNQPVRDCIACGGCGKPGAQGCVFQDDICPAFIRKMEESDGLIIGSPVYYAGPSGSLCSLLDRAFYSSKRVFFRKPAACIVNCRRGGASAAFDRLNKYFTITQMPVVSSRYWNDTHGCIPEDVRKDAEGLQTMRTLGQEMAHLLLSMQKAALPGFRAENSHQFHSVKGNMTMKMKILGSIMAGLLLTVTGCAQQTESVKLNRKPEGKILIVYYSQSGTKNTKTVAQWIRDQVGGDLFEITMVKPYSDSYYTVLKEAKAHINGKTDPEIRPFPGKIADYDLIFIGSPVWYGSFAPPVGTFLHSHDFTGKTVIPFCTHGGGGGEKLFRDMDLAIPKAKILPGLTMKGNNVVERAIGRGTADKTFPAEVTVWLNRIFQ